MKENSRLKAASPASVKRDNFAYLLIKYLVLFLFACIALWLTYLAGFSTSYISVTEHSYLIRDSFVKNILFEAVFLFLMFLLTSKVPPYMNLVERVDADEIFSRKCRKCVLLILFCLSLFLILVTQNKPVNDQYSVNQVAQEFIEKDYSALSPGGYVNRYPNQLGIVLILYVFDHLFGANNYLVFQICNAVALTLLWRSFSEISDLMGHSQWEGLMILVSGALFFPGVLYTTFVYGTLIGLSCSVNAAEHFLKYSRNHRWTELTLAAILSFIAVVIKNNYLIFVIGQCILSLALSLRKRDWKILLSLALFLCILLFSTKIVNHTVEVLTGQKVCSGEAALSWVAMGLQDENSEVYTGWNKYAGWYNNYNYYSYSDAGFDTEAQRQAAIANIQERLREFRESRMDAIRFFAGKNASQWNNPNFQGFSVVLSLHDLQYPRYINWLFSVTGSDKVSAVMNYLYFVMLTGVLIFIFFSRDKKEETIFYEVVAIGGFIFHTFWEAKCAYILPYVMLLIPLSVNGYTTVLQSYQSFTASRPSIGKRGPEAFRKDFSPYLLFAGLFLAGSIIIQFSGARLLDNIFLRGEDTEAYRQYVETHTYTRIKDGTYYLYCEKDGRRFAIVEKDGNTDDTSDKVLTLSDGQTPVMILTSSGLDNTLDIQFQEGKRCIGVAKDNNGDGVPLVSSARDLSREQNWYVHVNSARGTINLMYNSLMALTWDAESHTVFLSEFDGGENQQWKLDKADP